MFKQKVMVSAYARPCCGMLLSSLGRDLDSDGDGESCLQQRRQGRSMMQALQSRSLGLRSGTQDVSWIALDD